MMLLRLMLTSEDSDGLSCVLIDHDARRVIASHSFGAVVALHIGVTLLGVLIDPERVGECVDLSSMTDDGLAVCQRETSARLIDCLEQNSGDCLRAVERDEGSSQLLRCILGIVLICSLEV